MAFPVSPSNGATYTVGGKTFVYNSTKGVWAVTGVANPLVNTIVTTAGGQTIAGTLTVTGALTANVTGSASSATTAGTVTTAAQPNITSVGTLTTLTVDNITVNGDTISSVHNTITIDPSTTGAGGTVIIAGNLQVDGTTTIINSTTTTVNDLNIVLANGAANATAANGAGITIDGASASMIYVSTTNNWVFNRAITSSGVIESTSGGVKFPDGSTQTSAGASTGKAIAMSIVFG